MTKQLLLTGGTGMVGAYVMAECLREGHELVVLARRKGALSASQRVEKILCRFEESWGTRLQRPRVFECDLNEADLGLSDEAIRWIRTHCNQILHSAASLSFLPANQSVDNEPYRTNVDGTVRVCEFCKLNGIRQFHHVSTAYVCGKRTGSVRESEANVGQLFANDYERSKTIAETLLRQACESGKLDSLTIFRPSIVIDRTGLSPVSGDRTIYGAYSMYQMLASRFGLPEHGQWFRDLGFAGTERKNIVDVDWIARAIRVIVSTPRFHNATYHLTTESGTSVADLDSAFRIATDQWLNRSTRSKKNVKRAAERKSFDQRIELDRMAAPFVQTFLPYFRDDPIFDREQIDQVVMESALEPTPAIGTEELLEMVRRWSAFAPENNGATPSPPESIPCPAANKQTDNGAGGKDDPDDIVICGYEVRLPGGVENASDFERMLWEGKSGIGSMPASRLDRSLYFDPVKGKPGKTYTELGGCVSPSPLDLACEQEIETRGRFDLTHRQFAQVAAAAVQSAFGASCISELTVLDPTRAGVFVGHSGGTELGGPLAMGMLAEAATEALMQTSLAGSVDPSSLHDIKLMMVDAIRRPRPQWTQNGFPSFNAYSVASLAASLVGFRGRREVIDAACSSSLLALHHAVTAIKADRLDVALIGGATFNNVDNLALFSQSGACSSDGCYPFDRRASGLVSSEGYVAMVLVRRRVAEQLRLPVHATVVGVGIASDGKGKGLWAPRSEGQQLAIRRVSGNEASQTALDVDYLECHATSTQIGDATELQSLTALLGSASKQSEDPARKNSTPLFVGSAKSNLGHLLEAAGLVGMVKCLIAMKNGQLPPSINFEQPNDTYRWVGAPIQVVESRRPWPYRISPDTQIAGINAFGIGGLNAHAVIRRDRPGAVGKRETIHVVSPTSRMSRETEPIAIVGRGVVLPGAKNVEEFARLLQTNVSQISDPPAGRWPKRADTAGWVGVGQAGSVVENRDGRGSLPHCRGGYIQDFCFDAQSYRIPPKTVQFANPAQLMLIQAATEALMESAFTDNPMKGEWKVDRSRIGVVVSAIFGGEFSNALQVGLRLPEIQQHLASILRDRGFAESRIASEVGELREVLMERYPALLDETGGFTASTLASRLARVFDLMGGACAVDADEASSGLGILTAMEQLRGHHVDAVLCGMAHRSMDLVAFEQVYRKNQLVESGRIEDIPQDGSRIFPGEGVAVIVLQRLSDAVAAGRTVLGIIRDEAEAWSSNVSESRKRDSQESVTSGCASVPKLISQIGHLGGGQGIVRTIASTIAFEQRPENYSKHKVVETAQDGYQVRYQIAPQPMPNSMNHSFPQSTAESNELHLSQVSVKSERLGMNGHSVNSFDHDGKSSLIQIRLQSDSLRSIEKDLRQLIDHPTQFVSSQVAQFSIPMDGGGANATSPRVQAALVGRNLGEISRTAKALVEGPVLLGHSSALSKDCGWLRICEPTDGKNRAGDRIAWLFPGQGSQYSEVPKLLSESVDSACVERAEAFLQDIDSRLTKRGIEPVGPRMSDPAGQLGSDVWWTQLWVLAMGAAMTDSLRYRGYHPDVVLGHSFGECTAAWAAGVMDIDQAIEFAKCRSDAVIMTRQSDGQLLSVRGEPSAVQSVIGQHQLKVVISHHNSPMNTVVAGPREEIARAKSCFADARLAAVVINVPAAFHTPEMQPAQDLLRARFGGQRLLPPRCSVLSAVSNRYLAEPTDLMDNLIDQLTQPVCFHGAIKRIVEEGCGLLIEVGPSEVLTRLASSAVDGRAICLSADDRIKDYRSQQKLIDLACEAFNARQDASIRMRGTQHASTDSQRNNTGNSITDKGDFDARLNGAKRFDVVDVTRQRRRSGESADRIELPLPAANGVATNPVMKSNGLEAGVRLNGDYASTGCTEKIDLHAARSFLFDLVVDLTGYDPEIVEFDADLEAELGVDSIKKAQLIGEMIQWAGMPIEPGTMQLAQFETLNDIVGMLSQYAVANCVSTGVDDVRPVAVEAVNGQPRSVASASVKIVSSKDACKHDALLEMPTRETLERLIIDIVVDQTGYDESIIDLDADMEGELGIDSIKKAQLLGELEQQYRLQSLRDSNLTLADFTTLGSIRDFVWQQIAVGDDSGAKCSADKEFAGDQRDPAALTREKKNDIETAVEKRVPAKGTHRFELRTRPAPRLNAMPTHPEWRGPAVVLGDNSIADAIVHRWKRDPQSAAFPIEKISSTLTAEQLESKLSEFWRAGVSPHLFITTARDRDAVWSADDSRAWHERRQAALYNPFRVCQRWMQGLIDANAMRGGSLVNVVHGGGTFGFGAPDNAGSDHADALSAESGGMAGLTKAMLIEAWMRGYRDTPMLVIDPLATATPDEVVDGVWRELAVPSYDEEVVVGGKQRHAVSARYRPLDNSISPQPSKLTHGGNWVIVGGGRGITAFVAMELASRYGLKLHLLGTAPVPEVDDQMRQIALADRGELRRRVMAQVQANGGNPVTTWQKLEKAIEIDQTLCACRERSIEATYHSIDVSDTKAVKSCLQKIRDTDGPIRGVIQGAGAGQDARFDRKRPDKVEKCFRAKVDGCVSLAEATRHDPLEWFIGFGSISGRFGANGHTDYSAANEMLAKLVGKLKQQRPQTRCVTFHWHAWGDIGMATKPEAKLALDMIGMEFMPAHEGLHHFLNEIEHGGECTEVLITDRRYVRKFFPEGEDVGDSAPRSRALPMLDPEGNRIAKECESTGGKGTYAVTLNPTSDRFLMEHLVHGRPTLPFVMAIEMLGEAARASNGKQVVAFHSVRAHHPLKCISDDAFAIELVPSENDDVRSRETSASSTVESLQCWNLVNDLRRRDGRIVQASRLHFSATVELSDLQRVVQVSDRELAKGEPVEMQPVEYLQSDALIYHGPSLQCLREIGFDQSKRFAIGTIVTPSPSHLAGEDRPLRGWIISPATMDAVLYAAGALAYRVEGRASVPVSFEAIELGRMPKPGEPLRVAVRWLGEQSEVGSNSLGGGLMTAVLAGQNGDLILRVNGYQIGWLG